MSKSFELEGTLKVIMEQQTFQSGFRKREFVVTEEDDRYPQDIKLTMVQNNCALLDSFKPGDRVRVTFSLRAISTKSATTRTSAPTKLKSWRSMVHQASRFLSRPRTSPPMW